MPEDLPFDKKKDNPHVSIGTCNARHANVDANLNKILEVLRGDEKTNYGIIGDLRDIKRDKRWTYAIIISFIIPVVFLLINYAMRG